MRCSTYIVADIYIRKSRYTTYKVPAYCSQCKQYARYQGLPFTRYRYTVADVNIMPGRYQVSDTWCLVGMCIRSAHTYLLLYVHTCCLQPEVHLGLRGVGHAVPAKIHLVVLHENVPQRVPQCVVLVPAEGDAGCGRNRS